MRERIRLARKRRGFTQEELGKEIGTSGAFISMVESGKRLLSPEQVSAAASVLCVNEKWMAAGEGPMTDRELTRDRRSIGERLYQLRKEKKMTQAQFAERLGVSRLTVSLLERNRISVSSRIMAAAVGKLGADERWLRTGERTSEAAERIIQWLAGHPEDRTAVAFWLAKNS